MPEDIDDRSDIERGQNNLIPIGERLLGSVDPRALSREEFESSPDLLFHGAKENFELQRSVVRGPNSQTVGDGFYTTDDRTNAEFYSKIRNNFQGVPVIISVLPYNARVLDLRAQSDPMVNAPMPLDLVVGYRNHIVSIINTQFPNGQPGFYSDHMQANEFQNLSTHRSNLNRLIFGGSPIELRMMLSLLGERNNSEYGGPYFTEFMLKQGYDGLVYDEGGDHPDQKHTTSYVFYNLEKIGTYETWH